jgi:hypothetical protein
MLRQLQGVDRKTRKRLERAGFESWIVVDPRPRKQTGKIRPIRERAPRKNESTTDGKGVKAIWSLGGRSNFWRQRNRSTS